MTGILAVLIGYYIYLFGKGLITAEEPFTVAWFASLLIMILLVVAFVFTIKKARKESKERAEEEAKIKAEYERKRAEKARKVFEEDEFAAPISEPQAEDDSKSIYDS